METQYTIISERWASSPVEATLTEIEEQAAIYQEENERKLYDEDDEPAPISVKAAYRNGCEVVVDETGEIVGIATEDLPKWYGEDA